MKITKLSNRRALLLLATALLLMVSVSANAYDFSAENSEGVTIYYNITSSSNMTCEVMRYSSESGSNSEAYSGAVSIPETATYDGTTYTVTSIGESAFSRCSGLTSVTIPESVTAIDKFAFFECSGLTEITIPNSVTWIDSYAFDHCSGLTSVTIPERMTVIFNIFIGCTGLTSVTIPESVTMIHNGAFLGCSGLTEITIPNSVTIIGEQAFEKCSSLTSIYSLNPKPPMCCQWVFYEVNTNTCTLYVPKGSKKAYSKAKGWKDFGKIVEM